MSRGITAMAAEHAHRLARTHGTADAIRLCDLEVARAADEHELDRQRMWTLAFRLLTHDHLTITPHGGTDNA
jgi:hypothetical protein